LSRSGLPRRHREWRGTLLVSSRKISEIAFVADNLGEGMIHGHVVDHQADGMMATMRVQ
jgi:FtsP/CotA-like multicopper oxidase with cupredoxin domain